MTTESEKQNSRGGFSTKLGLVLAAAGSAIGLGNIWRFPTETGEYGGSAFLLVYLVCIVVFGFPLMIAEFAVGRGARSSTGNAYSILAPKTNWKYIGLASTLTAFLILGYYNVVAGWTLFYLGEAAAGSFVSMSSQAATADGNVFAESFGAFVSNPWKPIVCLVLFMAFTHVVITAGVKKGIERFSKLMMPLLFIIMLFLCGCSFTMPGFKKGMEFLFTPDFDKIDAKVIRSALAQCFYSFSLAMGCICTYASYFRADANLAKTAVSVGAMDTLAAILSGIVIFPAVFSVPGLEPDSGAKLVFIALPNVFDSALAGVPVLSWLVSCLFYLLLVIATVTSTVSLHEVITSYVSEHWGFSRTKSAWIVSVLCVLLGVICSLSMGPYLGDIKVAGMNIFDLFDFVTAQLMLPITGIFISIFVGWKMNRDKLMMELTSGGSCSNTAWLYKPLVFILRFVAPIIIAWIMIAAFLD